MPLKKLTKIDALSVKRRIWNGDTYYSIGDDFGITADTVYRIANGYRWQMIQWPDKSIGALPDKQKDVIKKARKLAYANIKDEVRKAVNIIRKFS